MTDNERRIDEINKTNDKLESIERTVLLINSNVEHHVSSQNQANERVNNNFLKLESEIKDQRKHFDGIINDNRQHFDQRITSCNSAITERLNNEFMTKSQIRALQDEEVIIQMDKRQKEIKEVKKELKFEIDNKVGGLKKLLYSTSILIIMILGVIVAYFKGGH